MNGAKWTGKALFQISRFVSFFLVICLIVTITLLLFLWGIELDEAMVRQNAPLTLLNLIILTVLGCFIDELRRKQMVDAPIQRITDALDRITRGDFSVRLDPGHRDLYGSGFGEIARGINHLAQELGSVETLRTDFTASVSHEFKTPLAVIGNYAALLRDPDIPEEKRQEYIESIASTTRNLANLVSNILKLNKLENQQIFPESRVFDLGEQLCESLLEFETAWEKKQLSLDVDIRENILVDTDPELLRLVWSNLFSNAIKFTPEGGTIGLTLSCDEGWAVVSIRDTGCGMNRETGSRIFEKFYQGDTSHAAQGNGLGLALVKRVVDITGGVIRVTSTPGKGSTFTVRLARYEQGQDS